MKKFSNRLRIRKRLVINGRSACYHVMSRTSCGQYLFDTQEKEMFRRMMRKQAEFCGLEVLSYAVMSNHFHILVRVPYLEAISDVELLRRYRIMYRDDSVPLSSMTPSDLLELLEAGGPEAENERVRLKLRMGDLSVFMRELKQRFSIWYNDRHKNHGTIWGNRFKSLLVEDTRETLMVLAAYIDLNAVRAGIVGDPSEYRYCSYGEAMGGNDAARRGLMSISGGSSWSSLVSSYRVILYGKGGISSRAKGAIRKQRVNEVISKYGEVSISEALLCRVRYFNDGMVLGSEEFVENIFNKERWRFGKNRKRGSHRLRGFDSDNLMVMRDLRK